MPRPRCASAALAALLLATPVLAETDGRATAAGSEPASAWRQARSLPELVESLEVWLDTHGAYPRRAAPVAILTNTSLPPGAAMERASRSGTRARGLYDPARLEIRLLRPWSPASVTDVSVLLHELVHHRQQEARHWYCPGQQEESAYRLQQAWLAEQGETFAVNWITVILEAGCTRRDIHPE